MKTKEYNVQVQKKNQNELRELEQFYVENKVANMLATIGERKKQLVDEMVRYSENHQKPIKWDKEGNPIAYKTQINPLIINNYFFKSITPITGQEPIYNAEKLGMVFDYYCELLAEVNDKIGNFPSSLTLFCKFSGLTLNTLRSYRNSSDYNMRVVVEKIYDQIGDENITMAQMGIAKERSTLFKMRAQNEVVEKAQPQVKVNVNAEIDIDRIQKNINKYKKFASKKGK